MGSEQDAKPAAWLRLTHYKDFVIIYQGLNAKQLRSIVYGTFPVLNYNGFEHQILPTRGRVKFF